MEKIIKKIKWVKIGIDPSQHSTGYSVFKDNKLIDYGKIYVPIREKDIYIAINEIADKITDIVSLTLIDKDIFNFDWKFIINIEKNSFGGTNIRRQTLTNLGIINGAIYVLFNIYLTNLLGKVDIKFIDSPEKKYQIYMIDQKTWKKQYGLVTKPKIDNIKMANKLFDVNLPEILSGQDKTDDIADAILIGNYGN